MFGSDIEEQIAAGEELGDHQSDQVWVVEEKETYWVNIFNFKFINKLI